MSISPSPLDRLPAPSDIHSHIGRLYRELSLLRRLLRLVQSAKNGPAPAGQGNPRREAHHAH